MKTNSPRDTNPILIFIALVLLLANAGFLFTLWLKGNQPTVTAPTPTPIQRPGTTPTVIPIPSTEARIAPVTLAWFTSLPKQTSDILEISNWFDLFILIRGDEDSRDLVKSMGVTGPILQYLEFETIQDPGSCSAEPEINQVTYMPGDFCKISIQHPDWFLLDSKGQRIRLVDDDNSWYLMDPANSGWQNFFLGRLREFQADPNWDGVFLDNVPVTLAFQEADGDIPAAYPEDASYQTAVRGFLQFLYEEYFKPNSKLLFANLVSRRDDSAWTAYLDYLDGTMYEGWGLDWPNGYRPVEEWERQMRIAEQTQQDGKYIILVSQGKQDDRNLQQFAFASYLLVNQGRSAFRYANSSSYNEIWLYDDYSLKLGNPLGSRYQVESEWRRDFAHGTVTVNPATHESTIEVNP